LWLWWWWFTQAFGATAVDQPLWAMTLRLIATFLDAAKAISVHAWPDHTAKAP